MKIVIAGGTGLIGRRLITQLVNRGNVVTVLTRNESANTLHPSVRTVRWNIEPSDDWCSEITSADAVINLTGESIAAGRWTVNRKRRILQSRVQSTQAIVSAIKQSHHKPAIFINASAVGFYGNVPEGEVTEETDHGSGFLADVCEQWEREAFKVRENDVRTVVLRTGIVLSTDGGVLPKMMLPFQFFLGGHMGNGQQWFPWIHIDDEVRSILFCLENNAIDGAVNLTAPGIVRMNEFCQILGAMLHRPSWFHIPSGMIKLLLGEMGESLLLEGQKAVSQKLIENGFSFTYPDLKDALHNIIQRER